MILKYAHIVFVSTDLGRSCDRCFVYIVFIADDYDDDDDDDEVRAPGQPPTAACHHYSRYVITTGKPFPQTYKRNIIMLYYCGVC